MSVRTVLFSGVLAAGLMLATGSPALASGETIAAPGTPAVSHLTALGAVIGWTPSPSPGVSDYLLFNLAGGNPQLLGMTTIFDRSLTSVSVTLTPETTYVVALYAEDANGNRSPLSPSTTFTTPPRDTTIHCQVHFFAAVTATGFYTNMLLTNSGTFVINGWTLAFSWPGNQVITSPSFFGGVLTQTGQRVTVTNGQFNVRLDAFQSTGVGFQGTYSGTFVAPTGYTLNGVPCEIT
jgi:hypothetical protein